MRVDNERGMVLLLVLVMVALLSALLSDFAFSTLIDLRLTEPFRDTTRAEYLARGGITAGRMILQTDRNGYDAKNDPHELWSIGVQDYPLAEGAISIKIDDLDARLSLNSLVDQQGNPNPVFRDRFIRLAEELALDNPNALADALIDWLDPDHDVNPEGAEDATYSAYDPPYEATDGPLRSIYELALIQGFDSETVKRIRPFVSSFGGGKLNINTASPELLRSWDAETGAAIDELLDRRKEGPFKSLNDLRDTLGVETFTALNRNLDLRVVSSYYLIDSQGQVNNGTRRMQAIVAKTNDQLLWQKVN
ncbi:MAG: type II secretion system minor pseudopilin GspK [Geopsychrobacter sp.]|nr:type II secretion system minor pseudopilin GspK [Geopsychrobacter sp.]